MMTHQAVQNRLYKYTRNLEGEKSQQIWEIKEFRGKVKPELDFSFNSIQQYFYSDSVFQRYKDLEALLTQAKHISHCLPLPGPLQDSRDSFYCLT